MMPRSFLGLLPGGGGQNQWAVGSGQWAERIQIGEIRGEPVYSYFPNGQKHPKLRELHDEVDLNELLEQVCSIVEEQSRLDDPGTNSGVVVGHATPGEWLYWRAVRDIVKLEDVEKLLEVKDFYYRGYKNRRGLIGAASALGWVPVRPPSKPTGPARTYELISYREKDRWGTEREWVHDSAIALDRGIPSSFDNYDHENDLPRIAPHTPCPVFYGVRGTRALDLKKAVDIVETHEPVDRWVIFETNHATDDHLQDASVGSLSPYWSVIVTGTVTGMPYTVRGGHTFIEIRERSKGEEGDNITLSDGEVDEPVGQVGRDSWNFLVCAAYEPTKGFRDIIRGLRPGDDIEVYGGLRSYGSEDEPELRTTVERDHPTLNLEKLKVRRMAEFKCKAGNPRCSCCGKNMKSVGRGQGYRCKKCGIHVDEAAAEMMPVPRYLKPGFYEVPVCARRHLSTPISMVK